MTDSLHIHGAGDNTNDPSRSYKEASDSVPNGDIELQWQLATRDFCPPCRSVPWLTLGALETPEIPLLTRQESIVSLADAPCPLCRFFGSLSVSPSFKASGKEVEQAFPLRLNRFPLLKGSANYNVYGAHHYLWSFGLICKKTDRDELIPSMLDPGLIEYSILRTWVRDCQQSHGALCQRNHSEPVFLFRVIDCESGQILAPPRECKFVALSYVWGQSAPVTEARIDVRFPATIKDSMIVTKELGYKYLWVDRYVR